MKAKCPVPSFLEDRHVYFVDGVRVPGVNEILKAVGLSKDYTAVDPFYRERGIASHKAIEYYLGGDLDEETLDPVCKPYLEGFKTWWLPKTGKKPMIEVRLYSEKYGFAGTIDMILNPEVIDYKCSKSPDPVSELQGLMYQWLVFENYGKTMPFKVLQLPGDGTHKEIPYAVADWSLVDAIMRLYKWKGTHVRKLPMGK